MAKFKTILAAAGMTAAAALVPLQANAQSLDYLDCKRADKDAQVVGGLVGGLLGAVAGHEIAGRGETTEGAVIGALAGAAAGAGIADDRRNCTEEEFALSGRSAGYAVPTTTVYGGQVYDARHPGHYHDRRDYRRDYRRDRRRDYRRDYRRGIDGWTRARDVRYRIEQLKDEDRRLKRRRKYEYAPWIERRRDEIRWEVKRLKRIEDRLKDRRDDWRDYRRDRRDYRRSW